jgi:hypothetical protein
VQPDQSKDRQRGRVRVAEVAAVTSIALILIAAGTALASHAPGPRPSHAPAVTPSATSRCVDSFDPACGPLRWAPAPGPNEPTSTALTPATISGVAGHPVSIHAAATDPDAVIACHWVLFGDEQAALIPAIAMQRQYGSWKTPAKKAGDFSTTYTHTYERAGTYRVQFGARSGNGCSNNYNPYGGESVSTATVTIAAS